MEVASNMLAKLSSRDFALSMHSRFMPSLCSFRPHSHTFNVVHHNSNSFLSKLDFYHTLPYLLSFDAFSIVESWLKPSISSNVLGFPDYHIFRGDRSLNSAKTQGGAPY